jgi:hypothetical protein
MTAIGIRKAFAGSLVLPASRTHARQDLNVPMTTNLDFDSLSFATPELVERMIEHGRITKSLERRAHQLRESGKTTAIDSGRPASNEDLSVLQEAITQHKLSFTSFIKQTSRQL